MDSTPTTKNKITAHGQVTTLRPLNEVLNEIRDLFDREGWLGVQGFSITLRSKHSHSNLKWGELRMPRRHRGD